MLTIGVDIAKATLEAAAWHRGQAIRLGSFKQTPAGWTALRDAIAQLEAPAHPEPPEGTERTESVAVVLEPTGGYELAFALWARQQPGWQVYRPNPARVRAWAPKPTSRMRCSSPASAPAPSLSYRRGNPSLVR